MNSNIKDIIFSDTGKKIYLPEIASFYCFWTNTFDVDLILLDCARHPRRNQKLLEHISNLDIRRELIRASIRNPIVFSLAKPEDRDDLTFIRKALHFSPDILQYAGPNVKKLIGNLEGSEAIDKISAHISASCDDMSRANEERVASYFQFSPFTINIRTYWREAFHDEEKPYLRYFGREYNSNQILLNMMYRDKPVDFIELKNFLFSRNDNELYPLLNFALIQYETVLREKELLNLTIPIPNKHSIKSKM